MERFAGLAKSFAGSVETIAGFAEVFAVPPETE
jgi:hypothetical protein